MGEAGLDLRGHSSISTTVNTPGQLNVELYTSEVDKTIDNYYEEYPTGQKRFGYYPYYSGSMERRVNGGPPDTGKVPATETIIEPLKNLGNLGEIRYIKIAGNESDATGFTNATPQNPMSLTIYDITFQGGTKYDIPVTTLPVNESFEEGTYKVNQYNPSEGDPVARHAINPANVVEDANAHDGTKVLKVPGSLTTGPDVVLANDSEVTKFYDVSVWVKGAPGSAGKQAALVTGADYLGANYNGREQVSEGNLNPLGDTVVTLTEDSWTEIKVQQIMLEAGKRVQAIVRNAGEEAADFYVDAFAAMEVEKEVYETQPAPVFVVDPSKVTLSEGCGSTITPLEDGTGYTVKYGGADTDVNTTQYGNTFPQFELDMGEGRLADYKSVTFDLRMKVGGEDVNGKPIMLAVAPAPMTMPEAIDYNYEGQTMNTPVLASDVVSIPPEAFSNDTSVPITLTINKEYMEGIRSGKYVCSVWPNLESGLAYPSTEYTISNITFNPWIEKEDEGGERELKKVEIAAEDFTMNPASTATMVATEDGKGITVTYGSTEDQYGRTFATFAFPKDVALLSEYETVTFDLNFKAGGDTVGKQLMFLVAPEGMDMPEDIAFDYNAQEVSNPVLASEIYTIPGEAFGDASVPITLTLDKELLSQLGDGFTCSIWCNVEANLAYPFTEYTISNVAINPPATEGEPAE